MQTLENLREKSAEGKIMIQRERERCSTKSKRIQGVLSTMLLIEFSRVFCNTQKPISFSMEKEMYLYPPELFSWVWIF